MLSFFYSPAFVIGLAVLVAALLVFFLRRERLFQKLISRHEQEMNSRIYELTILKELQDRFGYSLSVEKIVDIISGSLRQFIDFSSIAYILVEPEKLFFKCHVEESVPRAFVDDMKKRMLDSVCALTDEATANRRVEEMLTGAILSDELNSGIKSFFNIPLAIGDRMAGVLTVASTKEGKFAEKDVTIIYKIVRQASSAVQKLEEVLAIEQEKVSAMVESISDGIVMVDHGFRVVVANPAARSLMGILVKRDLTIFDLIDSFGKKFDIRGQLEESIKLQKTAFIPDVLIGEHWFEVAVAPVRSQRDQSSNFGAVVLLHDITHEKEIERLRQDFTSMMVHELRSPLDGINKISQILEKESKRQKKEYREMLSLVGSSSKDMLTLVSDLLDVAKIEAGKFTIFPQKTDIVSLVRERFDYFTKIPGHATLYVDNKVGEKLEFDCDPFRLKQVLQNTLSNAFKYTPPGGRVDISLFRHTAGARFADEARHPDAHWFSGTLTGETLSDCLVIGVTDTGEGIEKEKIPELFNKFKQLQTKTEKRGTGLGLIIAKGIIEAHSGMIGVGSERGVGSTFFFTLPLKSK